jgi:hypothetical protein
VFLLNIFTNCRVVLVYHARDWKIVIKGGENSFICKFSKLDPESVFVVSFSTIAAC